MRLLLLNGRPLLLPGWGLVVEERLELLEIPCCPALLLPVGPSLSCAATQHSCRHGARRRWRSWSLVLVLQGTAPPRAGAHKRGLLLPCSVVKLESRQQSAPLFCVEARWCAPTNALAALSQGPLHSPPIPVGLIRWAHTQSSCSQAWIRSGKRCTWNEESRTKVDRE